MLAIRLNFLVVLLVSAACAVARPPANLAPNLNPKAPNIAAKAYVLIDYNSRQILAAKNEKQPLPPASLTKMMTMYIVDNELREGRLQLEDKVLISETAWRAPGSRMFLKPNSKVAVAELIKGIIIQSGNDASIAMAEHIAGTESSFAELMNRYAQSLGMHDTNFANATGLPARDHYSTAYDMSLLAEAIIRDFPNSYKLYSEREFAYNGITQFNRNQLLWRNNSVDGLKTGHSDSAGYCLAASAKNNKMRLVAVLLNTNSEKTRTDETNKLLTWGFRFFESNLAYKGNSELKSVKLWMGKDSKLALGFREDFYVAAPVGNYKNYSTELEVPSSVRAPIAAGTELGTMIVRKEDGTELSRTPVVALKTVAKAGAIKRGIDYVQLSIRKSLARFKQ